MNGLQVFLSYQNRFFPTIRLWTWRCSNLCSMIICQAAGRLKTSVVASTLGVGPHIFCGMAVNNTRCMMRLLPRMRVGSSASPLSLQRPV